MSVNLRKVLNNVLTSFVFFHEKLAANQRVGKLEAVNSRIAGEVKETVLKASTGLLTLMRC